MRLLARYLCVVCSQPSANEPEGSPSTTLAACCIPLFHHGVQHNFRAEFGWHVSLRTDAIPRLVCRIQTVQWAIEVSDILQRYSSCTLVLSAHTGRFSIHRRPLNDAIRTLAAWRAMIMILRARRHNPQHMPWRTDRPALTGRCAQLDPDPSPRLARTTSQAPMHAQPTIPG
ncbi:hypothetical protein EXIGLDRAFT_484584 [Exidia glandulosa HHB12029]|uniref:Uncharacterized protein n=1 Tax=Exidia glandulosa HHB12029 TaxID=1314781 RepID=A0A166BLU9_EXIGL|nr:hypothetical protein EXIGLDRAFT_484584 [Exidia glandulosa HHB12029]